MGVAQRPFFEGVKCCRKEDGLLILVVSLFLSRLVGSGVREPVRKKKLIGARSPKKKEEKLIGVRAMSISTSARRLSPPTSG